MSLELIQQYHQRYLILSDQFKTLWTLNQVLQGIHKHQLNREIPYKIDFRSLYNQIRDLPQMFSGYAPHEVGAMTGRMETATARAFDDLHRADAGVSPTELRRFFESFKTEEEDRVILQIIKYYIHRQTIDDNIRDKLDFLITRVAAIYSTTEARFNLRDPKFLNDLFRKLTPMGRQSIAEPELKEEYLILLREMRSEVTECKTLEDFVRSGVLKTIRALKARMGVAFLHPEILVKIAELNVTTKNRYLEVYRTVEAALLEDTAKIRKLRLKHEAETPEMLKDMRRMEEMERQFEQAKEKGDLKLDVMARYKYAAHSALTQLESDFTFLPEGTEIPPPPTAGISATAEAVKILKEISKRTRIRVEEFEKLPLEAFQKAGALDSMEESDRFILKGLAHRAQIEQVVEPLLAAQKREGGADGALLQKAREIIKAGEELEKDFLFVIEDQLFQGDEARAQFLLRGKYRLMRSLAGLWLLLDRVEP